MPNLDWNGKLHMPQRPEGKPFPNGLFWAVTQEGEVEQLSYDHDATYWLGARDGMEYYSRNDGESGTYGDGELIGWTDSYEDACEAAKLYLGDA